MTEITKDLIKFMVEVIILLLVFSIVFDPERGIVSGVFNYIAYAEPILLQNYISSSIVAASDVEGEFITEVITSGYPYIVEIYTTDKTYISVKPIEEELLSTKFYNLQPTPSISKCYIPNEKIKIKEGVRSKLYIIKKEDDEGCKIYISPTPDVSELS